MLYKLLKIPAQFALRIYCRSLCINKKSILSHKGPLLIASNHPNSFLDAVLLATLFKKPIYSLVRGDVYKNNFYATLLTSLNMLPVYRISEGAHNLENNYDTFAKCRDIFKKNGIVLIFSEAKCINEWKLRPLRKGTARLMLSSWEEGIDLAVLPAGINYHSFTSFGKNIQLNFGNIIEKDIISNAGSYGTTINLLTSALKQELKTLVKEIDPADKIEIKKTFYVKQSPAKKIILLIPAILGYLLHAALYIPVQKFSWRKASHNDHYDSVLVGILFILYPFYLLLMSLLLFAITGSWFSFLSFILLPFCAWAYVKLKNQFT